MKTMTPLVHLTSGTKTKRMFKIIIKKSFITFLNKLCYINFDEGVICANWVANPYLRR